MKTAEKLAGISIFVLYCFAIFTVYSHDLHSSSTLYADPVEVGYSASPAGDLTFHFPPSELLINDISAYSTPGFKNPFGTIYGLTRTTDQRSFSKYLQYSSKSIRFPIKFRKSDINYPFNYFW